MRIGLGVLGVVLILVGVVELASFDLGDLVSTGLWLAGGVVLHDLVLAPVVVVLGWWGARRLPDGLRAPAAVGLVLVGAVTVAVLPTLLRFGAEPDNPSLFNRPYTTSYLAMLALVLVGTGTAWLSAFLARHRRRA